MSSPRTFEHSLAFRFTPEAATEANKASFKYHEVRVQPWMAFANPNDKAHSKLIAEAKPLSIIGLEKAELLLYAAENR